MVRDVSAAFSTQIEPRLQRRKQRAASLSIASNTTLIILKLAAGIATGSVAIMTEAIHIRTDAFTSLGVLVGLIAVKITGAPWIDPVAALLVAVAIVFSGGRILMRSARILVDESLPQDELEIIRSTVMSFGSHGVV